MIAEPPSLEGAVHETEADVSPAVAATPVGAPGVVGVSLTTRLISRNVPEMVVGKVEPLLVDFNEMKLGVGLTDDAGVAVPPFQSMPLEPEITTK